MNDPLQYLASFCLMSTLFISTILRCFCVHCSCIYYWANQSKSTLQLDSHNLIVSKGILEWRLSKLKLVCITQFCKEHCWCFHLCLVQRSEALQAALAKRFTSQDPDLPAPFKRQSLMKRKPFENGTQQQVQRGNCTHPFQPPPTFLKENIHLYSVCVFSMSELYCVHFVLDCAVRNRVSGV